MNILEKRSLITSDLLDSFEISNLIIVLSKFVVRILLFQVKGSTKFQVYKRLLNNLPGNGWPGDVVVVAVVSDYYSFLLRFFWIFWSLLVSFFYPGEPCHSPGTSQCSRPSPPSQWEHSSCRGELPGAEDCPPDQWISKLFEGKRQAISWCKIMFKFFFESSRFTWA